MYKRQLLGDLVLGTTINGKIYGVTGYRNLACSAYLVMRTDVLEDLGLLEKAQNMTSLSEYEAILAVSYTHLDVYKRQRQHSGQ